MQFLEFEVKETRKKIRKDYNESGGRVSEREREIEGERERERDFRSLVEKERK